MPQSQLEQNISGGSRVYLHAGPHLIWTQAGVDIEKEYYECIMYVMMYFQLVLLTLTARVKKLSELFIELSMTL